MDAVTRIERALLAALALAETPGAPPRLAAAMHHAVFPRGARIRPRLCLAVAAACAEDDPGLTDAAAASIELMHCASLVHDDLPCFDDAATRRGRASVHRAHGEPLAVLAGDALIVLAFQVLAGQVAGGQVAGGGVPAGAMPAVWRVVALMGGIGAAVGVPGGIVAGQAFECEAAIDLPQYQRAKTGALFAAATMAGAIAAGHAAEAWRPLGASLGEAYQVADDILDVGTDASALGKPVGQDAAHGRPSAVDAMGLDGAMAYLRTLAATAVDSIPACPGAPELRALILQETRRLMPQAGVGSGAAAA